VAKNKMKHIILGIIIGTTIGISLSLGMIVLASPEKVENYVDNGIIFLRQNFNAGFGNPVESFVDEKTGVACYSLGYRGGISCVKINN
jgi:predicted small secreted protein